MRPQSLFYGLLLVLARLSAQSLTLNSGALNPQLFQVTRFADGLSLPMSMQPLPDGSLAVLTSSGFFAPSRILRFVDVTSDRAAAPGVPIYESPTGPLTNLIRMGDYYVLGNHGNKTVTFLKAPTTAGGSLTPVADFQLVFPDGWWHPTHGLAARETPGQPGFYDLVFNVGAQFNDQPSVTPVGFQAGLIGMPGLTPLPLNGDSLYLMRIDARVALKMTQLTRIVKGIRNVDGMAFQPGTGDFYFADNAMDGPGDDGDEPPQVEELNRISAAEFGQLIDFGFPTCYVQYRTGLPIGTGCRQPFATFQPIPNPNGPESEGPVEIAFAPPDFPAGFNHGVFVGFAGKGSIGPDNEENAVVFHNFSTGTNLHFSESGQPGVGRPIGLLSTSNALFISDFSTGIVYKIQPAQRAPGVPAITLGGIVNAATYSARMSPGSFVAGFGVNLGNKSSAIGVPPLPLNLAGVSIAMKDANQREANVPLRLISDSQVNFLIPLDAPVGPASVSIKTPAGTAAPQPVTLETYAPGIFALDGKYGAILNAGTSNTTATVPAVRSGFVEIYCTGLGPVDGQQRTPAPTVFVGGIPAQVAYSGMPSIPGLYQVNIRIPNNAPAGAQPLRLEIGGVSSNTVLMQIAQN
jgi:uncharacterized protein (TIGR03437 family)